jgi:hypothetical protein
MIQPAWVGARCGAKERFVSGVAASGACGTTAVAAAEDMAVGLEDAGPLGTTAATGIGSVNAAPGLMADAAALFGDGARALSGGPIGAGSAGSTLIRPAVWIWVSFALMVFS